MSTKRKLLRGLDSHQHALARRTMALHKAAKAEMTSPRRSTTNSTLRTLFNWAAVSLAGVGMLASSLFSPLVGHSHAFDWSFLKCSHSTADVKFPSDREDKLTKWEPEDERKAPIALEGVAVPDRPREVKSPQPENTAQDDIYWDVVVTAVNKTGLTRQERGMAVDVLDTRDYGKMLRFVDAVTGSLVKHGGKPAHNMASDLLRKVLGNAVDSGKLSLKDKGDHDKLFAKLIVRSIAVEKVIDPEMSKETLDAWSAFIANNGGEQISKASPNRVKLNKTQRKKHKGKSRHKLSNRGHKSKDVDRIKKDHPLSPSLPNKKDQHTRVRLGGQMFVLS